MRAVIQRVSSAEVSVDGVVVGSIGTGLLVLLGIARGDTGEHASALAGKIAKLRVFQGESKPIDRSLLDVGGAALVVSQFTLCADTRKGNRPSFVGAAPPDEAKRLYESFCAHLRDHGVPVQTGRFAAFMQVTLTNDGPVTIVLP